tara:strand:- start:1320 stop:2285 length:966 start_codon:yes stop_codon:yes gene_type:complete
MAFPNISDILATTIESRTRQIADNVTKNNAILMKLSTKGKIKTFSGGSKILQELSFAENTNGGWYSGYDILPVGVSDVISAAEFNIKQAAVPVVISGLEMLQNAGREKMIDLLDARLSVAESTLANLISGGLYSDGTGAGGKEIDGLDAAVPLDPTTGTYGGIDRATWTFWQSKLVNAAAADPTTIQGLMNDLWVQLVRGTDRPDLIMMDNVSWSTYVESLQAQQRFTSPEVGNLGFPSIKFMDADVCLDGGIGGFCPAGTTFFLNCDYIHYRPHSARNMVPLSPNRRYATNQDAEVQILAWAGNLTSSGAQFQGRLDLNA